MRASLRLHRPTITGRLRAGAAACCCSSGSSSPLTTALTAAVGPLTERTADRAIAGAVRDAGTRGAVVATLPRRGRDPRGPDARPALGGGVPAGHRVRAVHDAGRLGAVVSPGRREPHDPAAAPARRGRRALPAAGLRRHRPTGPPEVTYSSGGPPQASRRRRPGRRHRARRRRALAGPGRALRGGRRGARARAGRPVPAEDVQHRPVDLRISGIFTADQPGRRARGRPPRGCCTRCRACTEGAPTRLGGRPRLAGGAAGPAPRRTLRRPDAPRRVQPAARRAARGEARRRWPRRSCR